MKDRGGMTVLEDRVRGLRLWKGSVTPAPISGGLSNANFRVEDDGSAYVVRLGQDLPVHHVFRAREAAVSRAAHAAGLSPELVHHEPGVMVFAFIEGRTYGEPDVRANVERIVERVRHCHGEMKRHLRGPAPFFWVFHVIRDYAHTLRAGESRMSAELPRYLAVADELEAAQVPLPVVFGHHDLLPGNFIDDGRRIWLIDWEYGGFGSPMFDLANIAANASFARTDEESLIEAYFDRWPEEGIFRAFDAMKAASALREAMWSMVSEIHLDAPGADYPAYTAQNLERFESALAAYRERYR